MSDTPPWIREFRAALAAQQEALRAKLHALLDGRTPEEKARALKEALDKMVPRSR
jgi:hypothetical protein